jgi:hypothetical protein
MVYIKESGMRISYHIKKAVMKICFGGVLLSTSALVIAEGAPGDWAKNFNMSGLVEIAASMGDDPAFGTGDASDIDAATLELGIDAKVSSTVNAHVLFLYEDAAGTDFNVDESTIEIVTESVTITGGKMYVPFGSFETHMISDPLTLLMGETNESAVLISMGSGQFQGGAYLFNGDVDEVGPDNEVDNLGLTARFAIANEGMTLDLGFDYISNIADSDGISAVIGATVVDTPSAILLHAIYKRGKITGIFEYLSSDSFDVADYTVKGSAAEPTAMNLELGYEIEAMGSPATIAISLQSTDDAAGFLPESALLIGFNTELSNGVAVSIEYANFEDYGTSDTNSIATPSGQDASVITGQIAVEF